MWLPQHHQQTAAILMCEAVEILNTCFKKQNKTKTPEEESVLPVTLPARSTFSSQRHDCQAHRANASWQARCHPGKVNVYICHIYF